MLKTEMESFCTKTAVMQSLEAEVDGIRESYQMTIEDMWQPADLLPNPQDEGFPDELRQIRLEAKQHDYDFWVVLIGDTITEEALPTYESWLMGVDGVQPSKDEPDNAWARWARSWTAEENRHGDVLNRYLYLSGQVKMREVERTVHYLIQDGFEFATAGDPYRSFVYTSFQELATHISHKRVGKLADGNGNQTLAKICRMIAKDEMRHHLTYREFVRHIFEHDPSHMMLAFKDMMASKIVMPGQPMREASGEAGSAYLPFSNAALRTNTYTGKDYVYILNTLIKFWGIDQMSNLDASAAQARDDLMQLPDRLDRLIERMRVPERTYRLNWVHDDIA